ncbi:hypothetical protein ACJX0J_028949, partial [Zea mays]
MVAYLYCEKDRWKSGQVPHICIGRDIQGEEEKTKSIQIHHQRIMKTPQKYHSIHIASRAMWNEQYELEKIRNYSCISNNLHHTSLN